MYHGDDTIITVKIKIRIFFKLIFFLEVKKYILQEKISNSKIPTRIFRKELQEGYKEIDLPSDKEKETVQQLLKKINN